MRALLLKLTLAFTLLPALSVLPVSAHAADTGTNTWPARAIHLIVPFPPGSSPDLIARLLNDKLAQALGHPVIVENKPGAGGNIGTGLVAKAAPDGYTLLMMSLTLAVNPSLFKKLPYDTEKDLLPVSLVASAPLILVVHPSLPVKSLKEFIAHAKANPGKFNFGSGGPGTTQHLSGELFNVLAGVKTLHVPYKSSAQMTIDAMGGQIDYVMHNAPVVQGFVQQGKLRGIAVTSAKRLAGVPELPTMIEAGLPGFEVTAWFGLLVPTGTPPAVIGKINTDAVRVLGMADVKERFQSQAAESVGNKPEEFAAFIQAEITKWARVIKLSGAKAE